MRIPIYLAAAILAWGILACSNSAPTTTSTQEPANSSTKSRLEVAETYIRNNQLPLARDVLEEIYSFDSSNVDVKARLDTVTSMIKSDMLVEGEEVLEHIKGLSAGSNFSRIEEPNAFISKLKDFGTTIRRLKASGYDKAEALGAKAEKALAAKQVTELPKLRKEVGTMFRNNLWREDITVKVFGSGNKTIEFAGGLFAANANIEDFHTPINSVLWGFGFSQARYKWYEEADEYTYYTIGGLKDSQLR